MKYKCIYLYLLFFFLGYRDLVWSLEAWAAGQNHTTIIHGESGHTREEKDVSNRRGQQDDWKCLQGKNPMSVRLILIVTPHTLCDNQKCGSTLWIYMHCCQQGILDHFNPSLKNFVTMGKHYEKALTGWWGHSDSGPAELWFILAAPYVIIFSLPQEWP